MLLGLVGCLPAGVFTSARPLEPGRVNAYPFVDITGGSYGSLRGSTQNPPPAGDLKGVAPGAGVRVGVVRRLELGARAGLGFAEVSALINLIDQPVWALAVAPRVQSMWVPPVLGRLPVLLSYDVMPWATITPRFGVGYAVGAFKELGNGFDDQGNTGRYSLSAAFLEGGCGLQFRLSRFVGLALDAYYLRSVGNNQVDAPGGGIALMLGPQPAPRAAAADNGR